MTHTKNGKLEIFATKISWICMFISPLLYMLTVAEREARETLSPPLGQEVPGKRGAVRSNWNQLFWLTQCMNLRPSIASGNLNSVGRKLTLWEKKMIKLVTTTATNENTHSVTCKKSYIPKLRPVKADFDSSSLPYALHFSSSCPVFISLFFSSAYTGVRVCVKRCCSKKLKFLAQISHVFVSLCPVRKKRRKKLFSRENRRLLHLRVSLTFEKREIGASSVLISWRRTLKRGNEMRGAAAAILKGLLVRIKLGGVWLITVVNIIVRTAPPLTPEKADWTSNKRKRVTKNTLPTHPHFSFGASITGHSRLEATHPPVKYA